MYGFNETIDHTVDNYTSLMSALYNLACNTIYHFYGSQILYRGKCKMAEFLKH